MDSESETSLGSLVSVQRMRPSTSFSFRVRESSTDLSIAEAAGDSAGVAARPSRRATMDAQAAGAAACGGRPREMTVRILVEEARQLLEAKARGSGSRSSARSNEKKQMLLSAPRAVGVRSGGGGGGGAPVAEEEPVRASSLLQTVVCHISCGRQHAHTRPTKTTTGAVRWLHSVSFYFKQPVSEVLEHCIAFSVCSALLMHSNILY